MTVFRSTAIATLLFAAASSSVNADIAQLVSVQDNTLFQTSDGSVSNGSGPTMFVGRNNSGTNSVRRGLVEFDLSSLPAGAVLTSATLRMNLSQASGAASPVTINRVQSAWGEGASNAGSPGGAGAPSQAGDATWIHTFFNTAQWTTPGGDFTVAPSASLSIGAIGLYSWTSAGLLADVQAWQSAPPDNHGWIMLGIETTPGTAKRFDTREATIVENRPTLIVEYTVPSPAGATLAVLGLGVMARRRRS